MSPYRRCDLSTFEASINIACFNPHTTGGYYWVLRQYMSAIFPEYRGRHYVEKDFYKEISTTSTIKCIKTFRKYS